MVLGGIGIAVDIDIGDSIDWACYFSLTLGSKLKLK